MPAASTYYVPGSLAPKIQRLRVYSRILELINRKAGQQGHHKTLEGNLRAASNPDLRFKEQQGMAGVVGELLESK